MQVILTRLLSHFVEILKLDFYCLKPYSYVSSEYCMLWFRILEVQLSIFCYAEDLSPNEPESGITESTRLSIFCCAEDLSPSGPKSATKNKSDATEMPVLSSIRYFPAAFLEKEVK